MPSVNSTVRDRCQIELGRTTFDFAEEAQVSDRLVSKARAGKSIPQSRLNKIAQSPNRDPDLLIQPEEMPPRPFGYIRSVAGMWSGIARDVDVPKLFEYKVNQIKHLLIVDLT